MTVSTPTRTRAAILPDLPPGGSQDISMPLVDLLTRLDDYAATIAQPITGATRFDVPPGLPDRLSIPREVLVPGRYQPRTTFDDAKLDELAESLKEHGVLTALKVFANEHGQLELIAGERRWRAAEKAGLTMLPVEICRYTLQQIAEISAIDNLQRDDLTPLEEGRFYNRLIDELQMSEAALSRRLSRNRAYIQQRRQIAQAAPEIQQALDAGEITFSQARGITSAAPGQIKVQQAALKKVREKLKYGLVSESDAKRLAEQEQLTHIRKDLKVLGWQIEEIYSDTPLVWGGGERPTRWSFDDQRAAAQAMRTPTGALPAPYTLTDDEQATLKRMGWSESYNRARFAPWTVLHGSETHYLHPDEVAPFIEKLAVEWQTLADRVAATGWQIQSAGSIWWYLISAAGRREMVRQNEIGATLDLIEAGKISAEPPKQAVANDPYTPCQHCGSMVQRSTMLYQRGALACPTCRERFAEEDRQQLALARQQVERMLDGLLDQASGTVLGLFAVAMDIDLRAAQEASLRDLVLDMLAHTALAMQEDEREVAA